ncbi:hypothetical protein Srubr_56110 [Streptomyces rubradiris]|uniref:Uncharacterized protein n=1 Tax=Streptomyces rubradiris TaxID=285531 RepID=A0ABQ3RIT7_STRRR|nr:hypothetical protein GCM10018792_27960 [Streptomyces rubradiris]GHI55765.1 hypothetical protein Srubr_56110 [Streptomyces rubradiris]
MPGRQPPWAAAYAANEDSVPAARSGTAPGVSPAAAVSGTNPHGGQAYQPLMRAIPAVRSRRGRRPGRGVIDQPRVTGAWSSVTQSSRFSGHSRLTSRGYPADR